VDGKTIVSWRRSCLALCLLCLVAGAAGAEVYSFTNALTQATDAEKHLDLRTALNIYGMAESAESANSTNLCLLARRICDLTYLTNSLPAQKNLVDRALACSLQAVKADSYNATAHACVAVCYAKKFAFAGLKEELTDSHLFKLEAEKAIALDPKQDIAYYLLGRWNYGVANVGLFGRACVKVIYGGLPRASNKDAIANFQKAIELVPDRIIYHAGLAAVYETTGQKLLEIAELKKCRDLKPSGREDQEAQREAVQILATLGQ
jgi:tetratricopeptide (TPR) repeat protein